MTEPKLQVRTDSPGPTASWLTPLRQTLLIFIAVKFAVVAALMVAVRQSGEKPLAYTFADISWYNSIATDGYQLPPDGDISSTQSNLAFFPLLPMLMRIPMALGLSPLYAGILVSLIASIFAAAALFRIGELLYNERVGRYLALSFAVFPLAAFAFSLPLSEALFVALAAWTILWCLRGNVLAAAPIALAAGLTRGTAPAVIAVVYWCALRSVIARRDIGKSLLAMAIAPLGLLAFFLYLRSLTGQTFAWLQVQEAWQGGFDFGTTHRELVIDLLSGEIKGTPIRWFGFVALVIALVLFVALLLMRPPAPIVVYTVVAMLMVLGYPAFVSQVPRLFLAVFTLLIPIAWLLAKIRPVIAYSVLAAAGIGSFVMAHYLLTHLPFETF